MKRALGCVLLAAALAFAGAALGETRIVDNRDQEKAAPERLNLRATPAANGETIGSFYSGTEVDAADEEAVEGYLQVTVGGKTGFMSEEYLSTPEDYRARYGEAAPGRAGEIDLTGLWLTEETLRTDAKSGADAAAKLPNGAAVRVCGIVGNWAYVTAETADGPAAGYVPILSLTETGSEKAAILMGSDAAGSVALRSAPNAKADEVLTVQNGAACVMLFGRSGRAWYRVRVGGVAGWVQNDPSENLVFLSGAPRSSVPFYPPLMQTAKDALLCSKPGSTADPYITLGEGMKVEVLGTTSAGYAYVRTLEGSAGAYESGDFGYLLQAELAPTESAGSVGVAQADDGDVPVVLLNTPDASGRVIGALVPGAQVRIAEYTQTGYVQLALGDMTAYAQKKQIRLLTEGNGSPSDRIPQRATVREDTKTSAEPANSAAAVSEVAAGSRVYMLAKCGEWAFVNSAGTPNLDPAGTAEDRLGFVRLDALSAPAGTTHLIASVKTDKVNMRERADRGSPIIGKARLGERLRVADYGSSWTCVVKEDGTRGYLMTEYLVFE